MRDLRRRFATLFATAYRADRSRFIAYVIYISVWQATPLAGAVLVRVLVDGIVQHRAVPVELAVGLLSLVAALGFGAARARSRTIHVLVEKCTEAYDRNIMRLSAEMPGIGHLEHPEFLDRLEQLRFQPQALGLNGPQSSVVIWGTLQALLVVLVLVSVDPILLVLLAVSVPSLWATRRAERMRQRAMEAASPSRRLANHFFELATDPSRAEEVRTLRVRHELLDRHREQWRAADRRMTMAEVRAAAVATAGRLLFSAGYVAAIALVVERGVRGHATLGQVVMTVVLVGLINQQISVILDSITRVLNGLIMVDRYLWLVDYARDHAGRDGGLPAPEVLTDGITLAGVTFRYPHSDVTALRDVDLHLPAGSVVAVVGENGAGKTTLVKLLTNMYLPTAGTIAVDGRNLADIDPGAWRERTTAAFQDPARFELALLEAVGVGDLDGMHDEIRVQAAMARAGAGSLPSEVAGGLGARLGPSFDDGANLSGGQWQKVALSRAMMRARPLLVVFDEPAANLDPAAERALFERHAGYARERVAAGAITLLVSHRFSTVRSADLIVVLSDRSVAEVGTHHQLMAQHGLYAELYELQAAGYR